MSVVYRLAQGSDLQPAQALLNARYASRGYGRSHAIPEGAHTFVAERDGEIIATVSLVIDGGTAWLVRLASSARSADVLTGLFYLAFAHGTAVSRATELLIEVNPHHVRFYEATFGFERVGEQVMNTDVRAPGQVMRIEVEKIARCYPAKAA